MRKTALLSVLVAVSFAACSDSGNSGEIPQPPCSDGEDNDGDGLTDFPDDPGCVSANDDTEDSLPVAQCQDGRDNDGDGKIDYPYEPGCFAPQADDETDDCPTGPNCPQCADGIDNDESGAMDYPQDPGCLAAADDNEHLSNPIACGPNLMVRTLPPDGLVMGELGTASTSTIQTPCGGGGGSPAIAFELNLNSNKVVEISTDDALTTADTVIDIRREDCMDTTAEVACNNDISATNDASKLTVPLTAGNYFIIISGYDSASVGNFAMQVKMFSGQGTACTAAADCGPGLVCRVFTGATAMTCEKPQCDDGVDDDADTKVDYPLDPGCTSKVDNDESDTCPAGATCPECGDGRDNDGDTKIDYPMDTTCLAAGDSSESCVSTDGVTLITAGQTVSTTVGATNDVAPTCGTTTGHTAPDKTFRLDLPAMSSLTVANNTGSTSWFDTMTLLDASCIGTPIVCSSSASFTRTNTAAGSYFLVVDGYSTGQGPFTLDITGKIANGGSCEGALAQANAISCNSGFTCKGAAGARTCQPGLCGDGIDNDGDTKIDFPNDPGCESLGDDTEVNPATAPVCSNALNDDSDAFTDWPADFGCTSAAGTSEAFCVGEVDPTSLITTNPITGTTVGLTNNFPSATNCTSGTSPPSNGPDVAYGLQIPVFLNQLTIDLSNSALSDTVVQFRDANCATQLACDDDSGDPSLQSKLIVPNVAPGGYAVIVDGYGSGTSGVAGAYTMTVKGIAAVGQSCTSPLFTGGANAVLACPTACTAGVCQ